ncbi:hypothetical protein [Paracraurococcus lichenis]|uniref:Uncharacterized protein n=1 Tax=Paracraurococcus lichenis TaxID=3064888 RepID=A0ABT9DTJ9_9PROT|nr:hypothetical protein [Paracraurococcus sp. LOR1-02]MDO9707211.1 hypothetical protein [Paracraurococcus sp. LOR1-02]
MTEAWQYQIRITMTDALAELARHSPEDPALRPLMEILARHDAKPVSQLDAFEAYVAEAERQGPDRFPLARWTKATVEDPEKRRKYAKAFTLYVGGEEVYAKEAADALEAALQPLVGGALVTRLSKHDTNPANNPQMPAQYRS